MYDVIHTAGMDSFEQWITRRSLHIHNHHDIMLRRIAIIPYNYLINILDKFVADIGEQLV